MTELVFASELVPAETIASMLTGSAMISISNKHFKDRNRFYVEDRDNILQGAESMPARNTRLKSPKILYRHPDGSVQPQFIIAWTDRRIPGRKEGVPKEYYIFCPHEEKIKSVGTTSHYTLMIGVNDITTPIRREEEMLMMIDHQLKYVMEILLLAEIFGIPLNTYGTSTNAEFMTRFATELTDKILANATRVGVAKPSAIACSQAYIDAFTTLPVHKVVSGEPIVLTKDDVDSYQPSYRSMHDLVKQFMQDNKIRYTYMPVVGYIMGMKNAIPVSNIRSLAMERDATTSTRFDCRIEFCVKVPDSRVPDSLLTRKQVNRTTTKIMDSADLVDLWNGTLASPAPPRGRGCKHMGAIYMIPSLSYKYFAQGYPTVNWRVDKIATQKRTYTSTSYSSGGEFMSTADEDDEYTESEGGFDEEDDIRMLAAMSSSSSSSSST